MFPSNCERGEVLGVAGLVGAGRSELGAALFGLDPILGGSLELKGKRYAPKAPMRGASAPVWVWCRKIASIRG